LLTENTALIILGQTTRVSANQQTALSCRHSVSLSETPRMRPPPPPLRLLDPFHRTSLPPFDQWAAVTVARARPTSSRADSRRRPCQ
jgi:hypothetical protein